MDKASNSFRARLEDTIQYLATPFVKIYISKASIYTEEQS
jgi:hypothetical protein